MDRNKCQRNHQFNLKRIFLVHEQARPHSETTDIVVTGILLALARMLGLRQNVCCIEEFHVRITFSYSNLHDMTNSITEISESQSAAARVTGNTSLVCMAVYIQVWGNACTHYLLTQHWVNLKVLDEEH